MITQSALTYKDDFTSFLHVYKGHFIILYGYCLKPVQLFESRLTRYRAFGLSNIISSLLLYSKTGLHVSMENHFSCGICTKVMKTLDSPFHSPVSSKMEIQFQRKDVLLSKVSSNYRKKSRGFQYLEMHIPLTCKYAY